jgi:hypothetical protein
MILVPIEAPTTPWMTLLFTILHIIQAILMNCSDKVLEKQTAITLGIHRYLIPN